MIVRVIRVYIMTWPIGGERGGGGGEGLRSGPTAQICYPKPIRDV